MGKKKSNTSARLSIDNPYQRSISFTTDFNQFGQGIVTVPYDKVHAPKLIDLAVELIISDAGKTDPYIIRALTGTNKQRVNIGNAIRYKLGYSKNFVVGEPIRFYTGTEKFVNSQEAVVLDSSDEYTLDLTKELGFTGSFKNGLGVKANDVIIGDISDNEIKEKFALITDDSNSNDIAKLLSEYKQMVLDAVKNRPNDRGMIWRDYYKNIGKITTSFDIKLGNATVKSATLSTAYAATIHKSQGSTYTNVIVDMMDVNNNFNKDPQLRKQLAYVAMSRPTNAAFVITNDEVSTRPDAISEYKETIDKYNKEYSDEARNNCKNS